MKLLGVRGSDSKLVPDRQPTGIPSHLQTVPAENPQKVPQLVQQQTLSHKRRAECMLGLTRQIDNAMLSKSPQEKDRKTDRQRKGGGKGVHVFTLRTLIRTH